MAVRRCTYCNGHVQWLQTKFGRKMLFDAIPIDVTAASVERAWLPGSWAPAGARKPAVLAPIGHYSRAAQQAARRVVQLHDCPQYRALRDAAGL